MRNWILAATIILASAASAQYSTYNTMQGPDGKVSVDRIGDFAVDRGTGLSGAGTQRVAISSDSSIAINIGEIDIGVTSSTIINYPGTTLAIQSSTTLRVSEVGAVTVTPGTGTFQTQAAQSGSYTVTPGTGTFPVSVAQVLQVLAQQYGGSYTVTPGTGTWTISGNVNASQSGTWTVNSLQNGSYTVTPGTGTWGISGGVSQVGSYTVTPGTGTWTVSGTVAVTQSGNWNVGQAGSYTVTPGTGSWTVTGTVAATQSGAWSVGVNNFPAVQQVSQSGSFTVTPGTGTFPVSIAFPTVQTVTVAVDSTTASNPTHVVVGNTVSVVSTGVVVSTGQITAYQGGPWSNSQAGSYTVTPGTGVWNVTEGGSALNVVSTGVVVSTGQITAYQGGLWNVGQQGSYTVTPGTGNWLVNGSTLAITNVLGSTINVVVANSTLSVTNAFTSPLWSVIVDTYANVSTVFPDNRLRVEVEGTQLFYTTYDFGVDTVTLFNAPVAAGGGVVATTQDLGDTILGTGTTGNGYSYLQTQHFFTQEYPGFVHFFDNINIESPVLTNSYRFWGFGLLPTAAPTATAPLQNAIGFEINTDGKMYAVAYSGGSRNVIQDLSAATGNGSQPTNAASHKYWMWYRGDLTYWAIDNRNKPIATMVNGVPGPTTNDLPIIMLAIAGATPPVSNASFQSNALWVADTARNGAAISDGTYAWRKATVTANNQLVVLASTQTVVLSTSGVIGSVSLGNTSGKTNIFVSSSATTAAITATVVLSSHVVTIGKTFYLQHVDLGTHLVAPSVTASALGSMTVTNAGVLIASMTFTNNSSDPGRFSFDFAEPLAFPSGTVVYSSGTANTATQQQFQVNMMGYEK